MKFIEIFDLLFEGAREDFVIKQVGEKLLAASKKERQEYSIEQLVDSLSQADPSRNKQYLLWIAKQYINNQFRLEDVGRINSELVEFERVKSRLQNKDINSYRGLVDLYNALEPFKQQEVVSGKEEQRRLEAGFFKNGEAEVFYNGSSLKIIIPKTEEASCFFGRGTKWCTAARENNYFDEYNNEGPLYIIMCRGGEKYQAHFGDSVQFMDARDQSVDVVALVEKYPELKVLASVIPDGNIVKLAFVDQTPEICLAAVEENGWALQYVKKQTEEICLAAVRQYGRVLKCVEQQTEEICLAAVKQNGWALKFVKQQTPKICLAAVKQDGRALEFVKEQTEEICLEAVKQRGWALNYVREQTEEICLAAVRQYGWALQYVKKQTEEICLAAVKQDGRALQFVKDEEMKQNIKRMLGV